jgi:hypothetical protein
MSRSPYHGLPASRFWKPAVAERRAEGFEEIHAPKFGIDTSSRIATAGSCFAQHIARYLRSGGVGVLDVEPPPPWLARENARRFGFGIYSARYGNIYVVRQLLQLAREALGRFVPADAIWERRGRYFDALRPAVEPQGMASPAEVAANRRDHLEAVRRLLHRADVLVLTLGLTESWVHEPSGTVFPTAPGTVAGSYDPTVHCFRNFSYDEICSDLLELRSLLRAINPAMKILLTVSPVPLAATASGSHVLVATAHSKAVLRAVAGQLAAEFADIDYFPSYEIINSPGRRDFYFEPNLRDVTEEGVRVVMDAFFEAYGIRGGLPAGSDASDRADDPVCEEAMLEAFGK